MKEADLKELGEDEGDYKSLVQSLDTWAQDRSTSFFVVFLLRISSKKLNINKC